MLNYFSAAIRDRFLSTGCSHRCKKASSAHGKDSLHPSQERLLISWKTETVEEGRLR